MYRFHVSFFFTLYLSYKSSIEHKTLILKKGRIERVKRGAMLYTKGKKIILHIFSGAFSIIIHL
jgi:hypothetical protein